MIKREQNREQAIPEHKYLWSNIYPICWSQSPRGRVSMADLLKKVPIMCNTGMWPLRLKRINRVQRGLAYFSQIQTSHPISNNNLPRSFNRRYNKRERKLSVVPPLPGKLHVEAQDSTWKLKTSCRPLIVANVNKCVASTREDKHLYFGRRRTVSPFLNNLPFESEGNQPHRRTIFIAGRERWQKFKTTLVAILNTNICFKAACSTKQA